MSHQFWCNDQDHELPHDENKRTIKNIKTLTCCKEYSRKNRKTLTHCEKVQWEPKHRDINMTGKRCKWKQ